MNMHLIGRLITDLFRFSPFRTSLTFILMLSKSLTSGIGLFLILPLLQIIGVSPGSRSSNGITNAVTHAFQQLHLTLNLPNILLSYVLIVGGVALLTYTEQLVGSALQQQYTCHLRTRLHRQLLQTQWSFFLKRKMSDLLYSLTSQVQGVSQCNYQLLSLINSLTLTIVYTGLAFLLSWPMTLMAIACTAMLLCFMLPLHSLTSKSGQHHLQQNQTIYQSIAEQLGALKMIKGSGLETTFIHELFTISSSLEQQNQNLTRITARSQFLYTFGSVVVFSLLLYTALSIFHVPLNSLLLLLIVFARLLTKVSGLQQTWHRILHQLPAFSEVNRLLNDCMAQQEVTAGENPVTLSFKKAITLDQLSFQYDTQQGAPVINQLSIQLPKNATTAIIGPSGAGKSTLTDLIVGLLSPTQGKILIDDHILTPVNASSWRKSIAYVTQDIFLFNASIRDNLTLFSLNQTDAALWHALHHAAADFVAHLEDGLDTLLGNRGVHLSGGERQRIALARALLMNPQLLVLDESTNALDRENLVKIQQALSYLRGKMTIIIISHQTEMTHFADQTIELTQSHQGVNDASHTRQANTIAKNMDALQTSIM